MGGAKLANNSLESLRRKPKQSMKKTGKRKPYFKPLFKVNASKSEDVEKQSQLMLENHKKLTNSTTTTTTKDGLRRNHAKPKKNQYVLVHSFLDDNDLESAEERSGFKSHCHHGHHHPFDMDISFNMSVGSIKRSSSCKSYASADCTDTETPAVSSTSMTGSASNGLTNLFKKSLKRSNTHEDSSGSNSNAGVNTSSDVLDSGDNLMDCLAFDPFSTSTAAKTASPGATGMFPTQFQTGTVSQPSVVEKQHRSSGFRKFYTRNKSKSKSKLIGRSKPITTDSEIGVVVEDEQQEIYSN